MSIIREKGLVFTSFVFLTGMLVGGLSVAAYSGSSTDKSLGEETREQPASAGVQRDRKKMIHNEPFDVPLAVSTSPSPIAKPANPNDAEKALSAENLRLRGQVATTQSALEDHEGSPIVPPKIVPARLTSDAIRDAITKAIADMGIDGGQVTSMDCTEYPCIAYGEGIGGRGDFEKLSGRPSMSEYANDSQQAFGFKVDSHQYFGLALVPTGDGADAAEVNKRLRYRMSLMQKTISQP